MILAFDPGVNTGWAALDMSGRLIACGLIEFDGFSFVLSLPRTSPILEVLVVEKPQVYRTGLQKGGQGDIVDTALRAGRLADRCFMLFPHAPRYRELFPTPGEWKKNVDKAVLNARIIHALAPEEVRLVPNLAKSKLHNVIDAIGLARWAARQA